MPQNLQATIRQLAETFAEGLLQAARSASLEEILQSDGAVPGRRTAGRPRKSSAPVAIAEPVAKRGRPAKRNGASGDVSIDRIVEVLRKNPKGLRSEQLRAQLKLEKIPFRQAAAKALDANLITRTGEKRSTTFFAK
ncbi:hypothetical protein [Pendulispora albinea]|uniref:Homologous-pairing protein 2 winged helix domain-containing protein n=1 Tax=Pendulispora albinea TaxID=2741071 RepID=A0ABZ2LY96_9BACT